MGGVSITKKPPTTTKQVVPAKTPKTPPRGSTTGGHRKQAPRTMTAQTTTAPRTASPSSSTGPSNPARSTTSTGERGSQPGEARKVDSFEVGTRGLRTATDSALASQGTRAAGYTSLGGFKFGRGPGPQHLASPEHVAGPQHRQPGSAQNTVAETRNSRLARGANALGAGVTGLAAVKSGLEAAQKWKEGDKIGAVESGLTSASMGVNSLKQGVEFAHGVKDYRQVRQATRAAMDSATGFRPRSNGTLNKLARNAAKSAVDAGKERTLKTSLESGAKGLAKVAGKAALKEGEKIAAKTAGRFVPGANVAIAAVDTANFVAVMNDPKATNIKKATAGVTMVGDWAAATNIPVVSQGGAVLAAASDFVGALWG